jgi:hypothetical protein
MDIMVVEEEVLEVLEEEDVEGLKGCLKIHDHVI